MCFLCFGVYCGKLETLAHQAVEIVATAPLTGLKLVVILGSTILILLIFFYDCAGTVSTRTTLEFLSIGYRKLFGLISTGCTVQLWSDNCMTIAVCSNTIKASSGELSDQNYRWSVQAILGAPKVAYPTPTGALGTTGTTIYTRCFSP